MINKKYGQVLVVVLVISLGVGFVGANNADMPGEGGTEVKHADSEFDAVLADDESDEFLVTSILKKSTSSQNNQRNEKGEETFILFHTNTVDSQNSLLDLVANDLGDQCPNENYPLLCPDGTCVKKAVDCKDHMVLFRAPSSATCVDGVCKKINLDDVNTLLCPDTSCVSNTTIVIQNSPPVSIQASRGFFVESDFGIYLNENEDLMIDSTQSRCEPVDATLVCKTERGQAIVSVENAKIRCEDDDEGLRCTFQTKSDDIVDVIVARGGLANSISTGDFERYEVEESVMEDIEGDEYGFVTNIDAIARVTIGGEDEFVSNATVTGRYLDKSSPYIAKRVNSDTEVAVSCGVSEKNEIVCKANHLESNGGGNVYCWGNNQVRACPNQEVTNGGGGMGKPTFVDMNTSKSISSEDDEILAWSWDIANDFDNNDLNRDGNLELKYVLRTGLQPNDAYLHDLTVETDDLQLHVDFEKVLVRGEAILFASLEFPGLSLNENGSICGNTRHFARSSRCDDRLDVKDIESDFVDVDDDDDGISTGQESDEIDKASPKIYHTLDSGWSGAMPEEERMVIREHLSSVDELKGKDFGLAIILHASENDNVKNVSYDDVTNTVQIVHDEELKLFGIFSMSALSSTVVYEDGREEVRRPWWSFLASKKENKGFKAGAELSKSVN